LARRRRVRLVCASLAAPVARTVTLSPMLEIKQELRRRVAEILCVSRFTHIRHAALHPIERLDGL